MSYRILPVPVPDSPTAEPGWEVVGSTRLHNILDAEVWGNDDFSATPQQMVSGLAHQENVIKLRSIAVPADVENPGPDDVVGVASTWMSRVDNLTSADVFLGTRPDARRQGVGAALWQHVLGQAREHGRTVLQSWAGFGVEPAEGDPDALTSPTGSGRAPASDPATRFALARGFQLEQVERHSLLPVPVDPALLERFRSESASKAGEEYELVTWEGPVPDEWIEQYCVLLRGMSTDAPTAGLTWEEEDWTPERVRTSEAAVADQGSHLLVTAVLHRPTGELAGYTAFYIEDAKRQSVFQDNTIVRGPHRGHRLGMLLKAANLQRLAEHRPDAERVHTWNAEENDFMLSINVALGFRPAGGSSAWELKLES
jgi:GNAT superfamily N-acetyltransferase